MSAAAEPPPAASAPAPRAPALAPALLLLVAWTCGIALWPEPSSTAAGAATGVEPAAPPQPVPPELAERIEDLVRGALAAGPPQHRAAATLGATPGPELMLARAVPPAALAAQRGVPCAHLDPAARGLVQRVLELSADALGAPAGGGEPGLELAWAAGARGGPFYLRLHGERTVLEWVRTTAGAAYGAWRHFDRDAAQPWLRDRLFPQAR